MTFRKYCSTKNLAVDFHLILKDDKYCICAELIEYEPYHSTEHDLYKETFVYENIQKRNAAISTICTKEEADRIVKRYELSQLVKQS